MEAHARGACVSSARPAGPLRPEPHGRMGLADQMGLLRLNGCWPLLPGWFSCS